jgi:hypothetical protein
MSGRKMSKFQTAPPAISKADPELAHASTHEPNTGCKLIQSLFRTNWRRMAMDAMISNSTHTSMAIAREFPFEHYRTVLDLGGGIGTLLAAIIEEHKHLQGVNFEIPELQLAAEDYLEQRGLKHRIKTVIGNFLQDIPANIDLYMVKNSLWNWDDENCKTIMKNVREAIGTKSDSRFLVIEYIIDEHNGPGQRFTTCRF